MAAVSPTVAGLLGVLATATCLSVSNVLSPVVYASGGNALTVLLARFAMLALVCRVWFALAGRPTGLPRRLRFAAWGSGAAFTVAGGALLLSFAYIPVSLTILILYTFPFLTGLLACVLDRRRPRTVELACMAATFSGLTLALLTGAGEPGGGGLDPRGVALGLLGAFSVAVSLTWNARALAGVASALGTLHMAQAGTVLSLIVLLLFGSLALPEPASLGMAALVGTAATYAAALLAMFFAVHRIGALRTAMGLNLEPVLTIGLSVALLGETLSPLQALGAAVVVGAVAVFQRA